MSATPATQLRNDSAAEPLLHVAFELGKTSWLLGASNGRRAVRQKRLNAGDLNGLTEELAAAKKRFGLPADCRVVSCYEAGRDGFWLHRYLRSIGVENIVVDSASIERNRKKQAKTDRLDAMKLTHMLIRHHYGEPHVWSVVRAPSVEDEDARQLNRELDQLQSEEREHLNRITSLLATQGVEVTVKKGFIATLRGLRLPDGSPVPPQLRARIEREHARLELVRQQRRALEAERSRRVMAASEPRYEKARRLERLKGIGVAGATVLTMEFFGWRDFQNRRQVAGAAGITPTPFDSGHSKREQGISKAGNARIRSLAIELAWCWLRYQPESALSAWFHQKCGEEAKRSRKVMIVALARRLLIAWWRYVDKGIVPEGAVLKAA